MAEANPFFAMLPGGYVVQCAQPYAFCFVLLLSAVSTWRLSLYHGGVSNTHNHPFTQLLGDSFYLVFAAC